MGAVYASGSKEVKPIFQHDFILAGSRGAFTAFAYSSWNTSRYHSLTYDTYFPKWTERGRKIGCGSYWKVQITQQLDFPRIGLIWWIDTFSPEPALGELVENWAMLSSAGELWFLEWSTGGVRLGKQENGLLLDTVVCGCVMSSLGAWQILLSSDSLLLFGHLTSQVNVTETLCLVTRIYWCM